MQDIILECTGLNFRYLTLDVHPESVRSDKRQPPFLPLYRPGSGPLGPTALKQEVLELSNAFPLETLNKVED